MKERIFKMAKFIVFATAITQLALSQIQIEVITKVFDPNIGFVLFGFTIFGVLMAFNSSSYQHGKRSAIFIGGTILVILTGLNYLRVLLLDISAGNLLTFEDIKTAFIIAAVSMVIYALGAVVMVATGNHNE